MLQYFQLHTRKIWGIFIAFVSMLILLTLASLLHNKFSPEIFVVNILGTASFVFLCFFVLFLDSFLTFRNKTRIFSTPPFQTLIKNGFVTELTGKQSRFLLTDKRLSGCIDGYTIKIDGTRKKLFVLVGVAKSATSNGNLNVLLKTNGFFVNGFIIEKLILPDNIRTDISLLKHIVSLVNFLKENMIPPKESNTLTTF